MPSGRRRQEGLAAALTAVPGQYAMNGRGVAQIVKSRRSRLTGRTANACCRSNPLEQGYDVLVSQAMASARAEERRLHPPRLCQPVAVLEVGFQLCRQLWPDRHQARFVELGVPNGQDTLSEIDVSHREPDTPSPSASTLTQIGRAHV